MHSLYDALLGQHSRQLAPVRCAHSTISQLHRYFEDVVLENNLNALVIESLPLATRRSLREKARVRELARGGRHTFLFLRPADALHEFAGSVGLHPALAPMILQQPEQNPVNEHFVVIADARFSALLATVRGRGNDPGAGDEVIWTFEPDVVYSALEYLMARVSAEHPDQAAAFGTAVRISMPKATSLQLTLSVTTKLAHLLQEQAGREIAVNRIAMAIRESLELPVILQKTVDEVGSALNVACCALRLEGQTLEQALTYFYFGEEPAAEPVSQESVMENLGRHSASLAKRMEPSTQDGLEDSGAGPDKFPFAVVPLVFQERFMGVLQVTSGDPARSWQENELMLLRTVSDQVAVAVNHADLFSQIQHQAMTDVLTGCYNRRSFEMRLDRDLKEADSLGQPLSLLMLDLDHFKHLNDTSGHDAGDAALRKLGGCFRQALRGNDSASRFGGDEFALILPQATADGARKVAQRLRKRIEKIRISGYGNLSASIGIASFPLHASSGPDLIAAADSALYQAKRDGRNKVCITESSKAEPTETPGPVPPASKEPSGSSVESRP